MNWSQLLIREQEKKLKSLVSFVVVINKLSKYFVKASLFFSFFFEVFV